MRIYPQKNSKKITDLASEYFLPPKTENISDILEQNFQNIICQICGAEAKNGSRFNIFFDNASMIASATILNSSNKAEWITSVANFAPQNISAIKCEECGYTHIPENFSKAVPDNFRAKIVKIHDQWTSVISHGKSFYIATSLLSAEICDGDEVFIYGISFKEIDDKMKISNKSISVSVVP